VLYILLIL